MSINNAVEDVTQMPAGSSREEQAKVAGHVIYNSLHNEPPVLPPVLPPAGQENTVMDSTYLTASAEAGKISSVRRTFCLFVTFDLILMFILWVIYTQLIGDTGYNAFTKQIKDYTFKKSLFDVVELSAVRFAFLLLAYALFKLKHWWVVALTTALTCAVLIAKIFVFDFTGSRSSNNPLSYILIIISFVVAWAETWFLDFKVLPHERNVRIHLEQDSRRRYGATGNRGGYTRFGGDDLTSVITEDNQFYSPLDSAEGSDNENEDHAGDGDYHSVISSRRSHRQENDYSRLAQHAWEVLWSYHKSPETDWKLESGKDIDTGLVHSMKIKSLGKVFRLKGVIDIPAKDLYEEMTNNPEEQASWNYSVKECKILQVVDENTDVLYSIAAEVAGGVITSRDFVNVRRWGVRQGVFVSSGMAVNHPDMPPQKQYVRGVNQPGGWVYVPLESNANKCIFYWYMNTDIKGWFPQKLVDSNKAKVLMDFFGYVTRHAADMTAAS